MRIATTTLYDQQTSAIENLASQQATQGNQLSTGISLNQPSDDPTHIAQDLELRTQVALGNDSVQNISSDSAELNTVDGALSSLTNVMQSARSLAVQGASDTLTAQQRQALADQVNGLLDEAIGLANTQYGGKYVFAGTATPATPPVSAIGSPTASVTFNGNLENQTQTFSNGQSLQTSVTLRQAFNYANTDGSPDVFQTLANLRNTLTTGNVVDQSAAGVNVPGTVITGATLLNSANLGTKIVPDSTGNVSIEIGSAQNTNGAVLTFNPATATINSVITAINGSGTGVTASFDAVNQKLVLTGTGDFQIKDWPSPGATDTANFTSAFALQGQADAVNTLSGQIGDIDNALQGTLDSRSQLGSTVQTLTALSGTDSQQVLNNTQVQSGLEDTDIAKVISQFSETQTALQAAYGTTNKLESKSLFDYLT
jgi:flagellar hook-associated protein 3 FlgL